MEDGSQDAGTRDMRAVLDELEEDLERLRVLYEQYFLGVERTPPTRLHEKIQRTVRLLEGAHINVTAVRFRLQGLRARLITFQQYWTRTLGQIEAGTFRRDILRAARRAKAAAPPAPDATASVAEPHGAGAEPSPRRRVPQPGTAELPPGVTAEEVRGLFKALVAAKRAAGETTDGLTYGSVVQVLSREVPRLQERHGCERVRLEIATTDGKVKLKLRPA
jgi:hypothetical protein